MDALQSFGIALTQALQTLSPALDGVMDFFSFLGRIEFYMIFITFVYWVVNAQLGFRIFMVLLTTSVFGASLKQLLHQPRPYWVGDVLELSAETSYGIPSTHASNTLSVWAYLANWFKKSWLNIAAAIIVLMIGISRLYLGVHFPHDVIVGWLLGLTVFVVFITYESRVAVWFNGLSLSRSIGYGFAISLGFIIIGLLVSVIIAPSPDPQEWRQFSTEARTLTDYFTFAGSFFGSFAGYVLMKQKARFQTMGSWGLRLGRYLVGLAGVIAALYGLDAVIGLLAADESVLGYILRYLRYGTATFWAMYLAPLVFLKLKLAQPQDS